jgi:hypothetical protein
VLLSHRGHQPNTTQIMKITAPTTATKMATSIRPRV